MKKYLFIAMMCLFAVNLAACNLFAKEEAEKIPVAAEVSKSMEVDLMNAKGEKVGMVALTQADKGVHLHILAEGLEPGKKAIHFHETAKCDAPKFEGAGSHFNPGGKEHGFKNPKGYHAGDLPNLTVEADGTVDLEITTPEVTLNASEANSLLDADGSAIVIHEKEDDYKTNPSGNSGARIVCGEIKK
ncbi:superoxide dismutase family protein [Chungangia koreensis]|uniref:Superoxide dismutase [Cu-Zn] n=1 Tax=Chungangia koreensis TaxID=752657 RepID=A0ABV8X617_9LACT